jgi:hypothetical protein
MLKIAIISAIFLASVVSASAEEKPAFTVSGLLMIGNGLAQLDGYDHAVKDGNTEKTVHVVYSFSPALTLLIAENIQKIRNVVTVYKAAHGAIIKKLSATMEPGSPKYQTELQAEDDELLTQPITDVHLSTIDRKELKLDENHIPPSVLSLILPIVSQ